MYTWNIDRIHLIRISIDLFSQNIPLPRRTVDTNGQRSKFILRCTSTTHFSFQVSFSFSFAAFLHANQEVTRLSRKLNLLLNIKGIFSLDLFRWTSRELEIKFSCQSTLEEIINKIIMDTIREMKFTLSCSSNIIIWTHILYIYTF